MWPNQFFGLGAWIIISPPIHQHCAVLNVDGICIRIVVITNTDMTV